MLRSKKLARKLSQMKFKQRTCTSEVVTCKMLAWMLIAIIPKWNGFPAQQV